MSPPFESKAKACAVKWIHLASCWSVVLYLQEKMWQIMCHDTRQVIFMPLLKGFGAQEAIIKEYLLSPIHVHGNVYIPYLLYYPKT
jgi:hypothetical protein